MKTVWVALCLLIAGAAIFAQNSINSGRAIGLSVARVTVEVFSDFQCPHCKELYERTLKPFIEDYARTGKVYLVHRFFPLPGHAHAKEAACYACAADRIGKYEPVCDVLFRKQSEWAENGKVDETVCSVLTPAEAKRVRALAKDPTVMAEVEREIEMGRSLRIQQTPTMIVAFNHHTYPVAGNVSYPIFRRFVDNLLSK